MESNQLGMDGKEEGEEMYNSDQGGQEQTWRNAMGKGGSPKDRHQEEIKNREKRARGRGEEGNLGGPFDITG